MELSNSSQRFNFCFRLVSWYVLFLEIEKKSLMDPGSSMVMILMNHLKTSSASFKITCGTSTALSIAQFRTPHLPSDGSFLCSEPNQFHSRSYEDMLISAVGPLHLYWAEHPPLKITNFKFFCVFVFLRCSYKNVNGCINKLFRCMEIMLQVIAHYDE